MNKISTITKNNKTSGELTSFETASIASSLAVIIEDGGNYIIDGIEFDEFGSTSVIELVYNHLDKKNIPLAVLRSVSSKEENGVIYDKSELIPFNTSTSIY